LVALDGDQFSIHNWHRRKNSIDIDSIAKSGPLTVETRPLKAALVFALVERGCIDRCLEETDVSRVGENCGISAHKRNRLAPADCPSCE
jgi:hypothetical protein